MLENRQKEEQTFRQFSRAEQLNPIKRDLGTAEELCTATGPPATHLKNSPGEQSQGQATLPLLLLLGRSVVAGSL